MKVVLVCACAAYILYREKRDVGSVRRGVIALTALLAAGCGHQPSQRLRSGSGGLPPCHLCYCRSGFIWEGTVCGRCIPREHVRTICTLH